jgi:hypothetical protein
MPVDLTPKPGELVTSQAPRPGVSPGQVAQPYAELAAALNEGAEGLNTLAVTQAEQAGYRAVTRDANGDVQVQQLPLIGPASHAYQRAVKIAALADGEQDARRAEIQLRQQFHDDPQGYLVAADAFKSKKVEQYTAAAGKEVGIAIGRAIDSSATQTFKGLLNEKERLDLARADQSMTAGIQSARNDAIAMARGGDTSSPEFIKAIDKIQSLTQERVNNPRMAYPKEKAQYDLEHLDGELRANSFLHHVDQVYKDQGVNPDGSQRGGYAGALEAAKQILTDPSVKLTEDQRNAYFHKATAEIRANEALRRQDIGEARAAESALRMASAYGGKIEPEEVEQVAQAYKAAGAPGQAARLYAWGSRAKLNDDFGRQPLSEQTDQINELRGFPRQRAAYSFFINKGYTPVQAAGIVGGLRGETANLNTTEIHDGGIGLGIAGWNGPRLAALRRFAADNKLNPTELNTQLEFVHQELNTGEKSAGDRLRAARTPEEAGAATLAYFRPKDFDVPGAHPERSRYARAVFNAFATDGANPISLTDGMTPNPSRQLWLEANRATTLQKGAREAWGEVMRDYEKSGIRPANKTVSQIVDAAQSTNDHALLEGIAAGTQRMDLTERQSKQPLPAQNAAITEAQSLGAAGELSVGQRAVMQDLERKRDAITKGLADNPIATTVANFPDRFSTPAPLNLGDANEFAAGIAQRGKLAQFARANWQSAPVSALDQADVKQIQGVLDTPDPAIKAAIFQGLSVLPDDVRNATLHAIAKDRPEYAVSVAAGGMMRSAPDMAQSILRGQMAIKADKGYVPKEGSEATEFSEKLDVAMPSATFTLAGRTDDSGPYKVAQGMIKARYADLSAQMGDTSGKLNSERLTQAVTDVTGGVLHHNGGTLIAPRRGMSQNDFDRTLAGLGDADLAGVSTLAGERVSPQYVRDNAQLESVGDGRYFLRLGKDPMRPIYAYTGTNSEVPRKFVLDLRNQPLAPQAGPFDLSSAFGPNRDSNIPQ